jgi:GxxExxY protein
MKDEYPHRELSAAIIGAAMKVLNGLRPGHDEKIYENSLMLELIAQGHQVEQSRMLSGSIIAVIWSAR